jgi:long-chain acyl-CoA synthetase
MAATIGIPDPKTPGSETVKAFIVLKPGNTASKEVQESIIEHCRKHLARYKIPRVIEFRESLPLSLIGKVLKLPLREEEKKKSSRNK